jgi:hypothetical protein
MQRCDVACSEPSHEGSGVHSFVQTLKFVGRREHIGVGRERLDNTEPAWRELLCLVDHNDWIGGRDPFRDLRVLQKATARITNSFISFGGGACKCMPSPQHIHGEAIHCHAVDLPSGFHMLAEPFGEATSRTVHESQS